MKMSLCLKLALVSFLALCQNNARAQSLFFKDVTASARVGMPTDPNGYGHGVALADFTGDGRPDIYLVSYDAANSLFRNNGNGRFTDVAANAGVLEGSRYDRGVAAADYDNDGDVDLYIASAASTPHLLYRNNGDASFDEVGSAAGLRLQGFQGQGVAWGDYDNDGLLDLFLPSFEHTARLYRQDARHRFHDVTQEAGIIATDNAVQAVFFDWDFDHDLDLFVSRGSGFANRMFVNQGNGRYLDKAAALQLGDTAPHGQGVAVSDYDLDGDLDIYMCNSNGPNRLYRNDGNRFREVASAARVADASRSLGCVFADFDNDGWPDLYVGNFGANKLYRNLGNGKFEDVSRSSGTDHADRAYGLATFDYDDDGRLDLFFSNSGQVSVLLHNESAQQNHLKISLVGKESNRNGIGAIVQVEHEGRTQTQPLIAGHSMVSSGDLNLHFGLGASTKAKRVAVLWPSGKKDVLFNVEAHRVLKIIEGSIGDTPRDTLAPLLSNLAALAKSDTSVLLTWSTNEAATAQVEYGLTTAYGDTALAARELSTRHAVLLRGLQAKATYHYRIHARDSLGNRSASSDFVFTLAPASFPTPTLKTRTQNLTSTSAEIFWQTREIANAWLEFGRDGSRSSRLNAVSNEGYTHRAQLTQLLPNTLYHAQAFARVSSNELLASHAFTFTTASDSAPAPIISNIEIDQITSTSARISWQTNIASDGQIEYGLDEAYDELSSRNTQLVTQHRTTLHNLSVNRLHRLRVRAQAPQSKLAKSGAYQFITLPNNGDLASNVELLGFLALRGYPTVGDVCGYADTNGEYALVCLRENGLAIVDLTDPRKPVRLATLPSVGYDLHTAKVYRNYMVAIYEYGPVQIINLAKPSQPEVVAWYDSSLAGGHNVFIDKHYAYVVGTHPRNQPDDDEHSGMHVIDLANPEQPKLAGKYEAGFYIHDLYVVNDTAYVGGLRSHQVMVLDVKNKRDIRELAGFSVRYPHTVRRGGNNSNVLIVNDEGKGQDVQFFDIRDLSNVRKVGSYLTDPEISPHNVEPIGNLAFIAYFEDMLRVVDYGDPTQPREVGFYDTYPVNPSHGQPLGAHQTAAWGVYPHTPSGNIYISDMTKGLYIFRYAAPGPVPAAKKSVAQTREAAQTKPSAQANETLATPQSFSLSNYPNPFRALSGTNMQFTLPREAEVELVVVDLNGRVIEQFAAARYPAGVHQLRWNGAVHGDEALAAGIYFVRLSYRLDGERVASTLVQRVMLLQ